MRGSSNVEAMAKAIDGYEAELDALSIAFIEALDAWSRVATGPVSEERVREFRATYDRIINRATVRRGFA